MKSSRHDDYSCTEFCFLLGTLYPRFSDFVSFRVTPPSLSYFVSSLNCPPSHPKPFLFLFPFFFFFAPPAEAEKKSALKRGCPSHGQNRTPALQICRCAALRCIALHLLRVVPCSRISPKPKPNHFITVRAEPIVDHFVGSYSCRCSFSWRNRKKNGFVIQKASNHQQKARSLWLCRG